MLFFLYNKAANMIAQDTDIEKCKEQMKTLIFFMLAVC